MSKLWLIILFFLLFFACIFAGLFYYFVPKNPLQLFKTAKNEMNPIAQQVDVVETSGTLVSGFPDLPVLPNSVIKNSFDRKTVPPSFEATWMTDQPVVQTVQWYITNLPIKGWEVVEKPDLNDATTEQQIVAKKGEAYLHLTVEDEDDEEKMNEMGEEQPEKNVGTPHMKTIINAEISESKK